MKRLVGTLLPLVLLVSPAIPQSMPSPVFVIHRPTVIAFFSPVSDAEIEKDPDTNEALSDFQLYASKAGPRLKEAGIDFKVASAVAFTIKVDGVVHVFKAGKVGVGYYFVAPGKQPRVEYGVHDDQDILEIALNTFGVSPPN